MEDTLKRQTLSFSFNSTISQLLDNYGVTRVKLECFPAGYVSQRVASISSIVKHSEPSIRDVVVFIYLYSVSPWDSALQTCGLPLHQEPFIQYPCWNVHWK